MKITIEPFLLDNTLMNCCVYLIAAAWMGVRIRILPTVAVSLFGAVYALVSLFYRTALNEPPLKITCFLAASLLLFRRAGAWRSLPFLLLSAALTGGTAMFLTLLFGGSVYADGTLIGTVPIRAALFSAFAALCLPRIVRTILRTRRNLSMHTEIVIRLSSHTVRLDALIDSGNLLKEPITGLPVVLIDRAVDRPLLPVPFMKLSGSGILYGERPRSVTLRAFGNAAVDCICVQSPEPIGKAQAIVPECLLPYDWRIKNDRMAFSYLGSPARASARWQTRYLMVHSCKRRAPAAARPGGGSALHRTCSDR